jgi:hypothetical protein
VLVIERLKRLRVPVLGLLDSLGFVKVFTGLLSWVGQAAFSGRNLWDAA